MSSTSAYPVSPGTIALIGSYLPRHCGIATFTADLLAALRTESPDGECWAVAMNDIPEGYEYPGEVRFEINQRLPGEYRLAADFLNMSRVGVACVQHEYGIFGGEDGSHVLDLLGGLRMPVVTTLHTVLQAPTQRQLAMTRRLAQLSDRLVVMSQKAERILAEVYGIPPRKVSMIPHGIPDVAFVDPNFYKDQYGVEGRTVILTFGLISPGKGIETMIDALPLVIQRHPEVVYIVLGATHPGVKREHGEEYRQFLERRARDLGVDEHVIFHNRFVELKELCELLGAADIYVTPYLNREQVVSGTLAYALGSGKAAVSTPYWYAEEMLADGRGRLVPFRDAAALAAAVNGLLDNEADRNAMRKRAYTYCREMVWKEVARRYLQVFDDVRRERELSPRRVFRAATVRAAPREIPQPTLDHIERLTDDVGILQHARFIVPDRRHGYCTDDNARALAAVMKAQGVLDDTEKIRRLACCYVSFLQHAFNEENGRFRNFMGYDRRWLEDSGSEDSHGRAIWGLGETVALAQPEGIMAAAQGLFEKALPAVLSLSSTRSWAFALIGIHAYLHRFGGDSAVRRVRDRLAELLMARFRENAREDWPWIEETLSYANGRIPQALILCGRSLHADDMLQAGLRSLGWLLQLQTDARQGHFVPIGSHGWYPRGGQRARFDQQPVEALGMIEACAEAWEATREEKWIDGAQRCLEWFLGRNDLKIPLYDHRTGGCCDGLGPDGPNRNQGAESTLACFLSLLSLMRLRSNQISADAAREAPPGSADAVAAR